MASFGKTFTPLDQPTDRLNFPCENWKGNQDPILAEYFFNSTFRRHLLKREKTWFRISRECERNLYIHTYMLYYLGKIGRHCCAHRKYFLRESLEMIGIWIPLSRVFACFKRFCSCEFVSRVRRLLFPLNSRVKVFASMNTQMLQISSWRVKCLMDSVSIFCGKLSSSCCTNTSFRFYSNESGVR